MALELREIVLGVGVSWLDKTLPMNPTGAIKLYEKLGFKVVEKNKTLPPHTKR